MSGLFFTIALLSLIAFIVGLIKPKFVLMPNRIRSSLTFLIIAIIAIPVGAEFSPKKEEAVKTKDLSFEYSKLTLKDYKKEHQNERKKIIENYIKYKQLDQTSTPLFYNCISQMSYTKSPDLSINEPLDWCYADFSRDPDALNNRVNFDIFMANFSGWDDSYRPLEKLIKKNMDDDSSYKHDTTTYSLDLNAKPAYAIVTTVFRGKNAYGATVKERLKVKVDIETGDILGVVSE